VPEDSVQRRALAGETYFSFWKKKTVEYPHYLVHVDGFAILRVSQWFWLTSSLLQEDTMLGRVCYFCVQSSQKKHWHINTEVSDQLSVFRRVLEDFSNYLECWGRRTVNNTPWDRDRRSSGLLRSDLCVFLTDVSGRPIGPIFKG